MSLDPNKLVVTSTVDIKNRFAVNKGDIDYYTKEEIDELLESKSDATNIEDGSLVNGQNKNNLIQKGDKTTFTVTNPNAQNTGQIVNVESAGAKSSVAFGGSTRAVGSRSFTANAETQALGDRTAAFCNQSVAEGTNSFVAGNQCTTKGFASAAFNELTVAGGQASFAEGQSTKAMGQNSHSEGHQTEVYAAASHAEGSGSIIGTINTNYGRCSHVEGINNYIGNIQATSSSSSSGDSGSSSSTSSEELMHGEGSHAEGYDNKVYGYGSHVEGTKNTIKSNFAHVSGIGHNDSDSSDGNYDYCTIIGKYASLPSLSNGNSQPLFIIGKGSNGNPSNAFEVYQNGTAKIGAMGNENLSIVTKQYVDSHIPNLSAYRTSDAQDVIDNNIREVAEGKCKTYIISANEDTAYYDTVCKPDGTYFDSQEEFEEYISSCFEGQANSKFKVQDDYVNITDTYILVRVDYGVTRFRPTIYKYYDFYNLLKKGDIILIIETDYPDRWFAGKEYSFNFFKMETAKIDHNTLVHTSGNETIGGVKTFSDSIRIKDSYYGAKNTYNDLELLAYGRVRSKTLIPSAANQDLGTSTSGEFWKDLYLSGSLKDGTNSVSVANIADKSANNTWNNGQTFTDKITINSSTQSSVVTFTNSLYSADIKLSGYVLQIPKTQGNRIIPLYNGQGGLGDNGFVWKELYVKELKVLQDLTLSAVGTVYVSSETIPASTHIHLLFEIETGGLHYGGDADLHPYDGAICLVAIPMLISGNMVAATAYIDEDGKVNIEPPSGVTATNVVAHYFSY